MKDNMMKVIHDNAQAQKIKLKNQQDDYSKYQIKTHKNYGKLPNYVRKYKAEAEEDEIQRMVEEERAKIPAGTRLMPEEERLETLKELQDSKKELNATLEKLPVVSKTL